MKSLNKYVNDVIVSICTNRKHHHDYRITISGFFILYWKLEAWFIMQRTVTILTLSSLKLEWELPSCSLFSQSLSFYSKSPPFSHCFIIQICKWRSVNESCIFTHKPFGNDMHNCSCPYLMHEPSHIQSTCYTTNRWAIMWG